MVGVYVGVTKSAARLRTTKKILEFKFSGGASRIHA